MSMILNFARISDDVLTRLRAEPDLVTALVYSDFNESDGAIESLAEEDLLDVDKSWHAMHYVLTGTAWEGDFPEAFLLTHGQVLGDTDLGYGPARF